MNLENLEDPRSYTSQANEELNEVDEEVRLKKELGIDNLYKKPPQSRTKQFRNKWGNDYQPKSLK